MASIFFQATSAEAGDRSSRTMKIICWNYLGLGNPKAVCAPSLLVRFLAPIILSLIETELFSYEANKLKEKWGFKNDIVIDCSMNKRGGLALFWKDALDVSLMSFSNGHIDIKINN